MAKVLIEVFILWLLVIYVRVAFSDEDCLRHPFKRTDYNDWDNVNEDLFRYIASILHNGEQLCSGAILCHNAILTAGRCLVAGNNKNLTVRVGRLSSNSFCEYKVKDKLIHPNFDYHRSCDYDIGIIWTEKINFQFPSQIALINLAKEYTSNYDRWNVYNTFWHILLSGESVFLKNTNLVLSNELCENLVSKVNSNRVGCIMQKSRDPQITVCGMKTVRGSPIIYRRIKGSVLLGIVTCGSESYYSNCRDDFPTVFIKIAGFRSWIKNNLAARAEKNGGLSCEIKH